MTSTENSQPSSSSSSSVSSKNNDIEKKSSARSSDKTEEQDTLLSSSTTTTTNNLAPPVNTVIASVPAVKARVVKASSKLSTTTTNNNVVVAKATAICQSLNHDEGTQKKYQDTNNIQERSSDSRENSHTTTKTSTPTRSKKFLSSSGISRILFSPFSSSSNTDQSEAIINNSAYNDFGDNEEDDQSIISTMSEESSTSSSSTSYLISRGRDRRTNKTSSNKKKNKKSQSERKRLDKLIQIKKQNLENSSQILMDRLFNFLSTLDPVEDFYNNDGDVEGESSRNANHSTTTNNNVNVNVNSKNGITLPASSIAWLAYHLYPEDSKKEDDKEESTSSIDVNKLALIKYMLRNITHLRVNSSQWPPPEDFSSPSSSNYDEKTKLSQQEIHKLKKINENEDSLLLYSYETYDDDGEQKTEDQGGGNNGNDNDIQVNENQQQNGGKLFSFGVGIVDKLSGKKSQNDEFDDNNSITSANSYSTTASSYLFHQYSKVENKTTFSQEQLQKQEKQHLFQPQEHRLFLKEWHEIKYFPRIDLRLFPNLAVLLLDGVTPESLSHVFCNNNNNDDVQLKEKKTRGLTLFSLERGAIFNLSEFLSNQQKQQQESLLQTQNNNKQTNGSKNNCDNASNGLFTHNYEAKEVIQAKTATKKAKLDSMLDNVLDQDECVSSENNGYHHDEAEEKVDSALSNIQNSNDEITDTPVTTNPHNTTRISSLLLSPIHEDKEEIEIETKTGMIINPSIINRKSNDHARQNHKINNPNKNEALTIKKFPDLTHLKLSQCALSEFSFMPPSNNVSYYSMSNTYNNDSPKKSIQLFSRFPNLRTLILSKNQILYSTTILNTGLPPTLTTLDLSYNFLSEFSPKANLFLGGQLRNLILSHNRITSISRKTCGIHKLYSLEKLCLDGNNLSDLTSDVSALTSLPMLSHLQLMGNSFSQDLEEEEYRLQTLTLFYNNKTRSSRDIDSIDLPVLDNIPVTTQELEQLELMLDFDLSLNVNDIVSKSSPAHHKEKQKTHRHHHKVTVNINNQLMEEWEQVCQGMMHDEETKDNYTERNVVDDEEDFFCSIGLLSTLIQAKKARGKRKKMKKKKKLAPVCNNIKKMNYSDHEMLLLDTLSSSQVYPHLIKMKKDNDSHHCQHHHGEENRGRKPGNSQISNKSSSNSPLSPELFEPFLTRIQAIEENIEHDTLCNDEELYLQQQASLANRFHRNKNKRMFIDRHDEQLAQTVNAPFTTKMRNNKTEENIAFLQELFKNEFNDEYWFEEVLVEKEEPTNLTSDSQHHTNDTVVDTTSQEEKDLRRKMSELLSAPTEQDEEEGPDDIIPQNLREMRVLDNLELYFHLYIFPSLQGGSGEEEEDEENDEADLLEDFPDGDNDLLMDFPSNDEESENESSIIQKIDGVENRNTDGSTTPLHYKKKKKKKKKKRLIPRIQLFPSDSFSVVSLSTGSSSPTENNVGTKEEKEQFIKLWNLSILPIGIYSFTRITPLIIKLRGFQGEAIVEKGKRKGGEKKEKFTKVADSQPCILCLSDKAIYFIKVFNEKGNSKEKRSSTRTSAIGSNQRGSLGRVGESGSSSIAGDNRSVFTSLSGNNNRQDDDTTSVYSFESSAAYSMFTRGGGGGPGTVMTTNSGGTLFSAIEETDNNNTGTSRVYPSPIPANAIFKEGHWPHAWARYSLSHLQKIVIGFGFQRLSLHFLNPGKTRNSKSYVYVIQCDKSTSVSIIQSIQSNLSTLDSQHHANISHNLIIENDDALFLDALNTAVSKNRNESSPNNNSKIGTILHYQILKQKWRKEFKESVERVIVLSDEHLFLLQEGYVGDGSKILTKKMMMKMSDGFITSTSGEEKSSQVNKKRIGDVTLSCIDSAPLYKVTQISVEDNKPNCVLITLQMKDDDTAAAAAMGAANKAKTNNSEGLSSSPPLRGGSFRRSGLLKMLSFTNRNLRYWRLICRDREGAEKLVKDVRNAMSIMF